MYQHFNKIYDQVVNAPKYLEWKNFVELELKKIGSKPRSILDVACGTCNNSILYARDGYKVIGIDQSAGMLKYAREKFENEGLEAKLYHQSFYKRDFPETADLAICFDFSINHILSERLFVRFLKNIYGHLNPGGIFFFDLKPKADWSAKFSKYEDFTKVNEKYSYAWKMRFDEHDDDLVLMKFILREKTAQGFRDRIENNKERIYSMEQLDKIIGKSGFKLVNIYDNFTENPPRADSKLWVYVLKK